MDIASSELYQDCVVLPPEMTQSAQHSNLLETPPKIEKKDRFRTWSGREFDGYQYGKDRTKRMSLGSMVLRKSTDDHLSEVERMERAEKEKFLNFAEGPWVSDE